MNVSFGCLITTPTLDIFKLLIGMQRRLCAFRGLLTWSSTSLAHLAFVYVLWWSFHLNISPMLNWIMCHLIELLRILFCKNYLLLIYLCIFFFILRAEDFNLMKSNLSLFSLMTRFWCFKKSLPTTRLQRFSYIFFLEILQC